MPDVCVFRVNMKASTPSADPSIEVIPTFYIADNLFMYLASGGILEPPSLCSTGLHHTDEHLEPFPPVDDP